jgi:serine/threonine protein kinase
VRGILPAVRVCPRCRSIYSSQVERCPSDGERVGEEKNYPLVGETLDRYRIVAPIGEGAMGCVYRATHTVLPREYAIKVLFRDFAGNATQIERFRREAQAASTMSHANIVSVADFVSLPNGIAFIVMELVAGRTLERAIQSEAPFAAKRTAHIARQLAAGLGEAHRMGFVHRDVKPSNIMLTPSSKGEAVKILDFGVVGIGAAPIASRLTGIGHIIGTPTYMAPEQVHDPGVGPQADLYALGVIMFEMLAGEPPFTGVDRTEVFIKHISEPPPKLPPCEGLETLIPWLLEKQPDKRPKRADDVIRALDRLGLDEPQKPSNEMTLRPAPKRNDLAERPPVREVSGTDLDTDSAIPGDIVRKELADTDPERIAKKNPSQEDLFPSLGPAHHSSGEWASWDPDGSYASLKPLEHNDTMPLPLGTGSITAPSEAASRTEIVRARERPPVDSQEIPRSFDPPTDLMYYEPELPNMHGLRTQPNVVDDGPTQVDFNITIPHPSSFEDTIPDRGATAPIPTPVVISESSFDSSATESNHVPQIQKSSTDETDLRHVVSVLDTETLDRPAKRASSFEALEPVMPIHNLGESRPPMDDDEDSPPLVRPLRAMEIPGTLDGELERAMDRLREEPEGQSSTVQDHAPQLYSSRTRTDLELPPPMPQVSPVRSSQELAWGLVDRHKMPIVVGLAFLVGTLLIAMFLYILR